MTALPAHLVPHALVPYGLVAVVATVAVLVVRGLRAGGPARRHRLLAALALAILAAVLSPPVEEVVDASLTAHMGQHLVLVVVVAPLLALADPIGFGPFSTVDRLRPVRRTARRALGRPAVVAGVVAVALVVMSVWHLPGPYVAAVDDPFVHLVEHASLLLAAVPVWMVVVAAPRVRRRFPVVALAALAAWAVHGVALGMALSFSTSAWYGPRWSLADQQATGALLWGLGGLVPILAAVVVVGRWLHRQERADAVRLREGPQPVSPPAVGVVVAGATPPSGSSPSSTTT